MNFLVASFTDAWIETIEMKQNGVIGFESHLLQMRGLKPLSMRFLEWLVTSHLLQMRGLKPCINQLNIKQGMSHLLQMRGLKHLSKP